jgi:glycosyltransferase involved in cell wall biosynthesis
MGLIEFPAISIIIPTYNQAGFLRETLSSIESQTYTDFEVIIVNDGSTDETPKVLKDYEDLPWCTVITQPNQRLPVALNNGFRIARGNYLTWTSSDNILLPRMLEILKESLDRYPDISLVYGDWQLIDDQGKICRDVRTPKYDRYLLMRINYINACFMYRHECQEEYGLYNPEYLYVEDWEYWWRMAQKYKMLRVPQILYQYRIHEKCLTNTKVRSQKLGKTVGYKKLEKDFKVMRLAWAYSKLKWSWLRFRLGQDPRLYYES